MQDPLGIARRRRIVTHIGIGTSTCAAAVPTMMRDTLISEDAGGPRQVVLRVRGFATPDDIEALESCQIGFAAGGQEWNDVSWR